MRRYIYFVLVFLLEFIAPLNAQSSFAVKPDEYRLYGKVVDAKTQELLFGASVVALPLKRGTTTKSDGTYSLLLPKGNYDLQVRFVGYRTRQIRLVLTSDTELNLALEPDAIQTEEITVSTDREKEALMESTQSLDVMTKEDLDAHRGQTFGESLKNLAGVSVLQTGVSIAKPVVRGLHGQRLIIMNAGIKQEGQQWGEEHAPEIDPFSASEIQLLRGAASVEYGADAIGGVIRSEPKPLFLTEGLHGETSVNLFANNRQGAISGFLEQSFSNGFGVRLQGSWRKAGDSFSPQYIIANTGFSELSGSIMLGLKRDWGVTTLYYSRFTAELGIFRGAHVGNFSDLVRAIELGNPVQALQEAPFSYQIGLPRQEIAHDLISSRTIFAPFSFGTLSLDAGFQLNQRKEFDAQRAAVRLGIPSLNLLLSTASLDIKLRHMPIGNFIGTVGISTTAQFNSIGRSLAYLIPPFQSFNIGAFVREEYVLDDVSFNVGLRYDVRLLWASPRVFDRSVMRQVTLNEQRLFQAVTASFGAVYQLSRTWSIAGNIGTAWRPPSINELYSDGVHHGTGQYEVGDRNIGVEQSYSLDATLRHQSARLELETSLFYNHISGFIFLEPTGLIQSLRGFFPAYRYAQSDTRLTGIDATARYALFDFLRLDATLSIVRGQNLDRNEPTINMPQDRLRLLAHIHLFETQSIKDAYVEFGATAARQQTRVPFITRDTLQQPNSLIAGLFPELSEQDAIRRYDQVLRLLTLAPPGYVIWELNAGATVQLGSMPLKIVVSAQNLFNARYRDYLSRFRLYADDVGRNVIVRLQLPIGNS
ncbi:MAG: TonB-dependent receptor [Chloroherpetonaceae bacterium]